MKFELIRWYYGTSEFIGEFSSEEAAQRHVDKLNPDGTEDCYYEIKGVGNES